MKITFKDTLGDKYDIPADQAAEAEASGLIPVTPEEIKDEVDEAKYGNQTAKALLYAGARGLTLGLSDQLLVKTGAVDEEELKQIKERNRAASIGGEIVGAVAPALFTGGTSIGARIAAATPAGFAAKLAARSGSKVAEEVAKRVVGNGIKQSVVRKAAELGTAGLVEGALFGEAQLVTEEALGDAEFAAESVLAAAGTGAAFGGAAGAGLGAIGGVAERALKKIDKNYKLRALANRTDIPADEKPAIAKMIEAEEKIDAAINLGEKQGVRDAAARLSAETGIEFEPTIGMLSSEPMIQRLESSIMGGISPGASVIGKQRAAAEEAIEAGIKKTLGAGEVDRLAAGDVIRKNLAEELTADLGDAPKLFSSTMETYGMMAPDKKAIKDALSTYKTSEDIVNALPSERKIYDQLINVAKGAKTIKQVEALRKNVGQRLSDAYRRGDTTAAKALDEVYSTITNIQDDSIFASAKKVMGDTEDAIIWTDGWFEAKEKYKNVYKKYGQIAKDLGVKVKNPRAIIDVLSDPFALPSEGLAKKFLDVNDFREAKKLEKMFPSAFEVARRQRLTEKFKSVKTNGELSPKKFASLIEKMDVSEKKLLFGDKYARVVEDIVQVARSLPENVNPSGSGFEIAMQKFMSPIYQATEGMRYATYKGGSAALNKYFRSGLPTMAAAESVQNLAKTKIQSATKGFFSAPRRATSYTAAAVMSESQVKRAKESLEKMQANPEEWIEEYMRKNKDFNTFMPNTSKALQNRMMAAASFLNSKFPNRKEFYLNDEYMPPKSELIKFNDYLTAIEKPFKVIDQLKEGYLNPRAMEAMKVVYPKIYMQIQQNLVQNMPKKLTPTQRAQLSPVLGAKVSPIADQARMMILQGAPAPEQAPMGAPKKVPVGAAKNLDVAGRAQTTLDRTLYRS